MKNKITISILSITAVFALTYAIVRAGITYPALAPEDTQVTLKDIYCKITHCDATAYGLDAPAVATSTMHTLQEIYDVAATGYYGRGWTPNPSGSGSAALSKAACEAASASEWHWFEDGNGDGDAADPEDGICVLATTTMSTSWNGDLSTSYENSYIAAYTCTGNFPNGTVDTYSGRDSGGGADNIWNSGDCALCQADCYDGKKDLPDQGSWTASNCAQTGGVEGPIRPEVLKKWKGTRLPSFNDFYGFCGYKDGGSDYETNCSSLRRHGSYGQMVGRSDECLDLSNSESYEWLSEQASYGFARVAGNYACSYSTYYIVVSGYRFRAVFRP